MSAATHALALVLGGWLGFAAMAVLAADSYGKGYEDGIAKAGKGKTGAVPVYEEPEPERPTNPTFSPARMASEKSR